MWLDADSALSHIDRLYAAARALTGNHADADDLVQDVFLTLLRRPRRLEDRSPMEYLTVMLRNAQIEQAEDPRSALRPERAA